MKRHSSLIPLSSHHQNALVLAKRLRGMKPETPEEDRIRMAQTALEFWVQGGREHFRDEEEVVLPIWARHSSIWSPEVERMLQDHLAIRSALDGLAECLSTGEAPDWRALSEMGERLDGHVRLEEQQIFERVQREVPEEDLARIEGALHGA